MAITPSFVQVAPDSTGKRIDNVEVTVLLNSQQRQVTVTGDPENPLGYGRVLATSPTADEFGIVSRNVDIGNYDSGRESLLAVGTVFGGGADIFVKAIILMNQTDALQRVVCTDGTPDQYFDIELAAKQVLALPFYGARFVDGVILTPDTDNTIVAHITGSQNA